MLAGPENTVCTLLELGLELGADRFFEVSWILITLVYIFDTASLSTRP